ncbi:MAG: CidA/LrgA family protein [Roseburia sp.]|nr:CidA/LrgA family protein [Roseburia sp.]MCM1430211.1 CidA/LrgA family protein [Muribaculaceae bacterium]
MRILKQFLIIILFSFTGELLHYVIPLQIPASIYGLLALFLALVTGVVRLEQVQDTAKYLIVIMPLMFIPAGVGLMDSWAELQPILFPVAVIMVVSTVLVMGISGRVTQAVIRRSGRKADVEEVPQEDTHE